MASPLHANGEPWSGAADHDGVAINRARQEHEHRYPELVDGERARLLVLGCEVGGRWAPEVHRVLASLTEQKCTEAPVLLRRSAAFAWHRRWSTLLSVAAQTALAQTLLHPGSPHLDEAAGYESFLGDLLAGG